MTLGTPPQSVTVEIDTGSADMWVATTKCVDCDSSKMATSKSSQKQYDGSASSSYVEKRDAFHVGYGTGSVSGVLATEKIDINGFDVDVQDFGAVFKKTGVLTTTPNKGLVGLCFCASEGYRSRVFRAGFWHHRDIQATAFL